MVSAAEPAKAAERGSFERLHHWLQNPDEELGLAQAERDIFPMTGYCALLGLSAHGANIPLFWWLGFKQIALFNVFSVCCFFLTMLLWRQGRQQSAWVTMIVEVLLHACFCCITLGWNSGFHYPITLLIPILFLATSFGVYIQVGAGVLIAATYGVLLSFSPVLSDAVSPQVGAAFTYYNLSILFFGLAGISGYYGVAVRTSRKAVAVEFERAEGLLLNVLPKPIADRLKEGESTIADAFESCTVLFADIVGFTPLSANLAPEDLVAVLNDIFVRFDHLTDDLGLEKIKTIGDNYMVASGIPEARSDHAHAMAQMALGMRAVIEELDSVHGHKINIRIGLHSGPVVAGVIGEKKFIYDLWGDSVNTAARMESHGLPGEIQLSQSTYDLIKDRFELEDRGDVEIKGKGAMKTYFLKGALAS